MADNAIKDKTTEEEVSQTIDLNKIIGEDISNDETLVSRIGQSIIEYMEERVDKGIGKGGVKPLKSPYSKEYVDSLDFKAAGKSKNNINMKLSGDMMASVDILKTDGAKITIGIDDDLQAAKAYGHMTDFKGHPTLDGLGNKREFFGVTSKELKDHVLSEFKGEIKAKKVTSSDELKKLISFIRGVKTLGDLLK